MDVGKHHIFGHEGGPEITPILDVKSLHSNPGKRITQYEVVSLFHDAYCSISNIQKCVNGFRSAGIYPFNSTIFSDEDPLSYTHW